VSPRAASDAAPANTAAPAYTVRISPRARRIRLTVTARDGLVVTLPAGVPESAIEPVIQAKRAWIARTLASVADRRELHEAGPEALLPDVVELRAFGDVLPVDYRHTSAETVRAVRVADTVRVSGAIDDAPACLAALQRWADREARERLATWLTELAEDTGLRPTQIAVRRQRTRWGSCSANGRVALSRNLVFVPEPLARAVLLHELVHLRVLDHSPRFWGELQTFDPDALLHRRALRHAGTYVPPWADA